MQPWTVVSAVVDSRCVQSREDDVETFGPHQRNYPVRVFLASPGTDPQLLIAKPGWRQYPLSYQYGADCTPLVWSAPRRETTETLATSDDVWAPASRREPPKLDAVVGVVDSPLPRCGKRAGAGVDARLGSRALDRLLSAWSQHVGGVGQRGVGTHPFLMRSVRSYVGCESSMTLSRGVALLAEH